MTRETHTHALTKIDQIIKYSFLALVALFPVFFLPLTLFPAPVGKFVPLALVVIVGLGMWLVARLFEGKVVVPRSWLLGSLVILAGVYFLSSLFSGAPSQSLMGDGASLITFSTLLLFVVACVLTSFVFRDRKAILQLLFALNGGIVLVGLLHIILFFFWQELSFLSFFFSPTVSPLLFWQDLGILFGLVAIQILIILSLVRLTSLQQVIGYALLALSFFFVALVNVRSVIVVVGIAALIILTYLLSLRQGSRSGEVTETSSILPSLLVFLSSLGLFLAGTTIVGFLSNITSTSQVSVRPGWESTFEVAKNTLHSSPFFGSGPATFDRQWNLYQPESVVISSFWDVDFGEGIGRIPTALVTTGVLGLLAWIALFALFLYSGIRAVLGAFRRDTYTRLTTLLLVLSIFYLFLFAFINVPGIVPLLLLFVLLGAFVALEWREGRLKSFALTFRTTPRRSFVMSFIVLLVFVGVVMWGYSLSRRYASAAAFQDAQLAYIARGELEEAEEHLLRAISLYERDLYYRTASEIALRRLDRIAEGEGDDATLQAGAQNAIAQAVTRAQRSVELDGGRFRNKLFLANVYASLVPYGVGEAYERAQEAYGEAKVLAPRNPIVPLSQAHLELASGNTIEAKEYIQEALEMKPNYLEAVFLLSQIEAGEGNVEAAIASASQAVVLAPRNPVALFRLGILYYSNEEYTRAREAFERAVLLNPTFSNAKYFLGFSYYQLDRIEDAIAQFEDVATLNPDNEEVALILRNLRSGLAPLAGSDRVGADEVEERESLPLDEEVDVLGGGEGE